MSSEVNVEFFDTTLRDGAQSLPAENQFAAGSKVEMADQIAQLGVGVIEAGFPRTPGDGEEVTAVAKSVGQTIFETSTWQDGVEIENVMNQPAIAGLSRTTKEDVEAAWDAVSHAHKPRIHTFVSTDSAHMAAKFPGKTPEEVLEMGRDAVRFAKQMTEGRSQATVEFSAEAASTTEPEYLERIVKTMIDEGADVINLPDTVGQRNPMWMYRFYGQALRWIEATNSAVTLSAHNHNDIGLAAANSIALVQAATDHASRTGAPVNIQIESTVCGLGERAGNADVFPVAAGLFQFAEELSVPITWRFNPGNAYRVAREVMSRGNMQVHRQSPIVGDDINAHRSGIHSDGIIKGGFEIYTPQDPRFWGHPTDARHEEGKYQGRAGRQAANHQE